MMPQTRMLSKTVLRGFALFMAVFLILTGRTFAMTRKPPDNPPGISKADFPKSDPSSLSIHDCFQLSLQRNEELAIREETVNATKADFLKATSEALGDIDFEITDTRQDAPKPSGSDSSGVERTSSARHRRERKFVFTQPLFQGFKSWGALAGAGSLKNQRKEEAVRTRQLLYLDVAHAFYDVLVQQKDIQITEEILRLYLERMKELSERETIGRSRTSELLTTKTKMKTLEAELASSRGALEKALHVLSFYTGALIAAHELREENVPEESTRTLEEYYRQAASRADVKAAWEAVKTAKQGIVVTQSALWPQISLEHNEYVKREGFQSGFDWDLILTMDVPLFRGGENAGKLIETVSRYKTAKFSHSLALREAQLEIKEAYEDWHSAIRHLEALKAAVKISEENFAAQKEEYSRNLVSNLDVLEALESLHDLRRETNRAHYEFKGNYWRLAVATGEQS